MSQILRAWLAFAALGAGILHLALVISSPFPIAIVLLLLGASEFGWGLAVLSQNRLVLPTLARAAAIAPVLLWGTLLLVSGLANTQELASSLTFVPMAMATIFDLAIAITLSIKLRRGDRMPVTVQKEPGTWRYLGGLFAGGLIVSMLMTPALSVTEAGLNNPHAGHNAPTAEFDPDHH